MWFIIDWIVDVFTAIVEKDLIKAGESSFFQKVKEGVKYYKKARKVVRTMQNPSNLIKSKALGKLRDKSGTFDTWFRAYKEIKGYSALDPRSWSKAKTFIQRYQIRMNNYTSNDLKVNMGESSAWIDYIIWRAVSNNSIYGWMILKVKKPSQENPSGIYLFPPVVSLNVMRDIERDPTGTNFWNVFLHWWRGVYPRRFFSKQKWYNHNMRARVAEKSAQMGQWNTVINISSRAEWDRVEFGRDGKRLPTLGQKMRNTISKWHSNYLLGFGKSKVLSNWNPLTKRYTKYPAQFNRLMNQHPYSKVYGRTYIRKNKNRLINRNLTRFQKLHPLAPKSIIRKVRRIVNKYYNS